MTRFKMVSNFLGLTQSTVGLLFMVVLVGMGERMAERFLPIYLLALGGGVMSIGLLNGLDNFLSAVYAFPGGYLSERIGSKRALLVFNFMAMAGFLMVGILVGFLAALAAIFFEMPALALTVSTMFVLLMSGLILYETSNIIHGGESNYIMATVSLYVAIFNLFTSLLHLLGAMGGQE